MHSITSSWASCFLIISSFVSPDVVLSFHHAMCPSHITRRLLKDKAVSESTVIVTLKSWQGHRREVVLLPSSLDILGHPYLSS